MIDDVWRTHQTVGLIVVTTIIPFLYYKRIGAWATLLWAYTLVYSCVTAFRPSFWKDNVSPALVPKYPYSAAQTGIILLALVLFTLETNWTKWVARIIVLNAIPMMIFGYGAFNVFSMDTTAMVIASVYLLCVGDKIWGVFGLFSSFYGFGETAMATMLASLWAWGLQKYRSRGYIIVSVLSVPAVLYVLSVLKIHSFEARIIGWKTIMDWWVRHSNIWVGQGPGSFEWIAPFIKLTTGETFLWMHNDYLQFIFDYGVIGSVLFGFFIWVMGKKAWRTDLFPVFVAGLTSMLAYFPLRFFLTQVLFLYVLKEIYECESSKQKCSLTLTKN